MKLDRFDVVKLKNGNRATIIDKKSKDKYIAEIVNPYGITLQRETISRNEISKVIYKKAER